MATTPDERKLRHPATAAPTEDNHHAPKPPSCRVPSTTFKKECDDDDAAARTNPRISPGTRRVEGGRGSPDALQEGWRRPQASPRWCRQDLTWISPDPSHPPPRTNLRLHHTCRPPTCASTVTRTPPSSHHGQRSEAGQIQTRHPKTRTGSTAATREGTTSTGLGGSRPGIAAEAHQTKCPAGPRTGP